MWRFILIIVVLLHFNPNSYAQSRTVGLVQYKSSHLDGYCLFSPVGTKKTFLIDKCGRKINEWTSDYAPGMSVTLQPDGNLYRAGAANKVTFGGGTGGIIEKFDWKGNLVWSFELADSNNVLHHDFKVMPNGNILVIIWENHSIADAISQGRDSAKTLKDIWSERIEEIQPYGTDSAIVIWQWKAWDHIIQDHDSTKANYGVVSNHRELFDINFSNGNTLNSGQDWFHFNSIDYHVGYDQILLTAHSLDEIYIIDHSTSTLQAASHSGGKQNKGGDVLFRWGNPESYRMGTSTDKKFYKPHHAHWAANDSINSGKILIFNNGQNRPGGNYSSINSLNPQVTPFGNYIYDNTLPFAPKSDVVEYKAKIPTDFYSEIMGGVFQTGDNRFFITEATKGTFFEVNKDTLLWKYVNPYTGSGSTKQGQTNGNNFVFRSQFYPSNYSAFDGKDMTPGDEIEDEPYPTKLCDGPPLPNYTIRKINTQSPSTGVADSLGVRCQINAVVQSNNFSNTQLHVILNDGTGGIRLYNKNTFGLTLTPGDSITAIGSVMQENGWLVFGNLDTVIVLDQMKKIKPYNVNQTIGEINESLKIKISKVRIKDKQEWPITALNSNTYKTIAILHTDNTLDSLRIYSGTQIAGSTFKTGYLDITGFIGQNDISKPFKSNYFIIPNDSNDIQYSVLPSIGFTKTSDTLSENQTAVSFNINTNTTDLLDFDITIIGGNATQDSDYLFSPIHLKTTPATPLTAGYGLSPKFAGIRYIQIGIKNLTGPAQLGPDSILTIYIKPKTVATTQVDNIANNIIIFPNPSLQYFYVNSHKEISAINIYDMTGKPIYHSNIGGHGHKYTHTLTQGYYTINVRFIDGSQAITKMLIGE